jgi:hypothetical protein
MLNTYVYCRLESCFPNIFAGRPRLSSEKTTGYNVLAHVSMVSNIINLYLGTDITLVLINTNSTYKNTFHDLTLIKILVSRSVGAGASLIGILTVIRNKKYSKLKKLAIIFNKIVLP